LEKQKGLPDSVIPGLAPGIQPFDRRMAGTVPAMTAIFCRSETNASNETSYAIRLCEGEVADLFNAS
jgi:hypothetical protein